MILLYGSRPRSNPAQLWGCVELDSCTGVLGTVDTLCHKCGYPPLVFFFSSFTFSFLASLHEFRSALDGTAGGDLHGSLGADYSGSALRCADEMLQTWAFGNALELSLDTGRSGTALHV